MTELGEYGLELAAWRRSQEATARITRKTDGAVDAATTASASRPVDSQHALGYGSEVA